MAFEPEPESGMGCCCNDCAPGELVEPASKGRDSAEALEHMGGGFLANVQNAAGVVMEALQDDGISEDSEQANH